MEIEDLGKLEICTVEYEKCVMINEISYNIIVYLFTKIFLGILEVFLTFQIG